MGCTVEIGEPMGCNKCVMDLKCIEDQNHKLQYGNIIDFSVATWTTHIGLSRNEKWKSTFFEMEKGHAFWLCLT